MLSEMEVLKISKARRITPERVCQVADVCEKYRISPHGNVFRRTAEDLEKIILLLQKNGLNPDKTRMAFLKTPEDVEEIIKICKENTFKIEPYLFDRQPEQLQDSIRYVKGTYGDSYVIPSIVTKDVEKLTVSMPLFKLMGILRYTRLDASVFELSREEIIERTGVITYLGDRLHRIGSHSGEDRINHVYVLSEEGFDNYCYINGVNEKIKKLNYDRVEKMIIAEEMKQAKKSVK